MKSILRTLYLLGSLAPLGLTAQFQLVPIGPAPQQSEPRILFLTENAVAGSVIRDLVVHEHNIPLRNAWIEAGNAANTYVPVEARDVPDLNIKTTARLAYFGLATDDPVDKGFTDFLTSAGYNVTRSQTERTVDPIFGTVTATHEFHGTEQIPGTGDGASGNPPRFILSQSQKDKLAEFDMIIVSPGVNAASYSWGGGETMKLHDQWNLPIPIISMNAALALTAEFGAYGWGFSYGFTASANAWGKHDRRVDAPGDRFIELSWLPAVLRDDSALDGVQIVGGEADIYIDYEINPQLPSFPRKFSNNANFSFNANVRHILDFNIPSFWPATAQGVIEVNTKDIAFARFAANQRFFSTGAPMTPERILTPRGERFYLAAGMGASWPVFNLNTNGQRILFNLVNEFIEGGEFPGETLPRETGFQPDSLLGTIFYLQAGYALWFDGSVDSPNSIGTVYWSDLPPGSSAGWFYHVEQGSWFYGIATGDGALFAYSATTQAWTYSNLEESDGLYYAYASSEWLAWVD